MKEPVSEEVAKKTAENISNILKSRRESVNRIIAESTDLDEINSKLNNLDAGKAADINPESLSITSSFIKISPLVIKSVQNRILKLRFLQGKNFTIDIKK